MAIAYTNDRLEKSQMVGASSVLIRANGLGAIGGLLICGLLFERFGPGVFFYFIALLPAIVAIMAFYRFCFGQKRQQKVATIVTPTHTTETMLERGLKSDD